LQQNWGVDMTGLVSRIISPQWSWHDVGARQHRR
jgi:hypothetical protein